VAYLNDLQWARGGTVDLLAETLRQRSAPDAVSGLILLASYRSDEVAGRPMASLIDASAADPLARTVELRPLDEREVATLLRSMLGVSGLPSGLADRVAEASGGLPFFVEEILRDLLEAGRLGEANFRGADLTFDAAASFRRRSSRASPAEAAVLNVLAVCGRPADPDVIRRVASLSHRAAHDALATLGERQMTIAVPGERERYNLAHDRMRETLYAALSTEARERLHLSLARALGSGLEESDRGELLFETVGHYEQARPGLEDPGERIAVARLMLRAALATSAAGAFAAGASYLGRARELLGENAYKREYSLALGADHALASTLIPLGRVDEAMTVARRIVANATGVLDAAPGYEALILAHTARNEYREAIRTGKDVCATLGLPLPERPSLRHIASDIGRVLWRVRRLTDEQLASLPPIQDERAKRLIRIMTSMTGCSYVTEPNLWPILVSRCLGLMLEYGRGPTHALLFAWFANGISAAGLHKTAVRFTRLGVRLMDAPDGVAALPRLHHAMGQFLSHWRDPLARSVEWCRSGVAAGEKVEDAEFAGYCHMGWAKGSLDAGEPLAQVQKVALDALFTIRASGQKGTEQMHRPTTAALEVLLAAAPPDDLRTIEYLAPPLSPLSNAQNGFRLFEVARLRVLFRLSFAPEGAGGSKRHLASDLLRVMKVGLPVTFYGTIAHVFATLGWLRDARALPPWNPKRLIFMARALVARRALRRWARWCPPNYEHRSLLADAEWFRTIGRSWKARRTFERSIAAARTHGFTQDVALGNELLAEMLLERGDLTATRPHARAALAAYSRWGATAKVQDIKVRYATSLAD
jgi:predicted ATPase